MKKSKSFDLDFLAGAYDFDPLRHFFGNRSGVEKFRIDLSLGDDESCTLPVSSGVQRHARKRIYVLLNLNVFAEKIVCFGAIDDFEKIFVIVISKNNI